MIVTLAGGNMMYHIAQLNIGRIHAPHAFTFKRLFIICLDSSAIVHYQF